MFWKAVRDYPLFSCRLLLKKVWGEFIDPAASPQLCRSMLRSSHQCQWAGRCVSRRAWGQLSSSLSKLRQQSKYSPLSHLAGNKKCSVHSARQENKTYSFREYWYFSQWGTRTHVPEHKGTWWRLFFPPSPFPSPLNRSDYLAPSQHHLWLRVHLFWITIPTLDLWLTLALKSHFSRNDNEFEDKSWKNTLLWQLRFSMSNWQVWQSGRDQPLFFPLGEDWGSKIYWLWLVLRDKDKNRPFGQLDIWQQQCFPFWSLAWPSTYKPRWSETEKAF